jgi:peptidoglycan/xylan/chitin deacetylase (PgdA/CDA1 family)
MIWRTAMTLASRGRLPILIFHRILAEPDPILPGEPSAAQFEALLAHVASRFEVLPLAQAARRLFDGTLPPRALSITFDDGYANNLSVAAPILKRRGIPATVFVATGYLGGRCMFNDAIIEAFRATKERTLDLTPLGLGRYALGSIDERRAAIDAVLPRVKPQAPDERDRVARDVLQRAGVPPPEDLMLAREAIRELPKFGVDVGAHTVTHPILARVPDDVARREIAQGRRELEALAGSPVTLFAYPNGRPGQDYAERHVDMVREAGFAFAVTTAEGAATRASDPLQLPRYTPWSSLPMKFDLLLMRNMYRAADKAVRDSVPEPTS